MSALLIDPQLPEYQLGYESMDQTHVEFIDLVNQLGPCSKQEFPELFKQLVHHTEQHFEAENELMEDSGFPAIREHQDEHARVLGEMHRFAKQLDKGSTMMARAYITERLPDWFDLHARTMDSALAAHLKHSGLLLQRQG
jgi:hemerythrin-like metal-binding protein